MLLSRVYWKIILEVDWKLWFGWQLNSLKFSVWVRVLFRKPYMRFEPSSMSVCGIYCQIINTEEAFFRLFIKFITKKIQLIHVSEISFSLACILLRPYLFLHCPNVPSIWSRSAASFFLVAFWYWFIFVFAFLPSGGAAMRIFLSWSHCRFSRGAYIVSTCTSSG